MRNPTTDNCNSCRQAMLPLIGMTEFIGRERRNINLDDITANYHKDNPESVKANRGVDKLGQTKRILDAFKCLKQASCEDIERITKLPHQSASARISELKRDGRIVKAGTGKTKSGCSCALYSLV